MRSSTLRLTLSMLFICLVSACASTHFEAAAPLAQPVDMTEFAPKADTFLVLLDTSGSMRDDDPDQAKFQTAQNMVANFNAAVPEAGFNSGLIIFGKGAGSCMGDGVARTLYGMETYNSDDFLAALNTIDCVRSTTPIVDAVDLSSDMLDRDAGDVALIIFSDFRWPDPEGVKASMAQLRNQSSGQLCLHTVRIGDYSSNNALIDELHAGDDCGSAIDAADITDPGAMTAYVTDILMSPIAFERYTLSAMTLFDFDKSELKAAGKTELNKLSNYINSRGIRVRNIDVIGHTDSVGTQIYNAGLSERRAAAVAAYLQQQGVNPNILRSAGMGELDPVVPNTTDANRALNRRVEVLVGAARPPSQ